MTDRGGNRKNNKMDSVHICLTLNIETELWKKLSQYVFITRYASYQSGTYFAHNSVFFVTPVLKFRFT